MNRFIVFLLGLLIGILGCVLLYRFDKKMFNRTFLQPKKEVVVTRTDTVYIEVPQKQKKQPVENKPTQPVLAENIEGEDSISMYDAEFSFEGTEDDVIFSAQLLQTKTVKVKVLSQEKQELPENFFHFFEIQQWSTLIKNKVTYHRNQSMVKIKGMEVAQVSVVFWNDAYFLEIGNRYYAIPETEYFEKLNSVQLLR
jgi:hypothetical protein